MEAADRRTRGTDAVRGVSAFSALGRSLVSSSTVAFVLVAVGWIALQLVVVGSSRYYEWDEAVYASQVAPGDVPDLWSAHRARGIVWLIAPLASGVAAVDPLRLYLMALSAAAFVCAGSLWARLVGRTAILGLLLFVVTWPAIIHGSTVSPNLWMAVFALAATALLVQGIPRVRDVRTLVLAGVIAGACLFRPLDAFILAAVLSSVGLFMRGVSAPGVWVASGGGWLVGLMPYWLEAERWGGLWGRFAEAGNMTGSGFRLMMLEHLRLADGPHMGPDPSQHISLMAIAWWAGLVVFALIGAVSERGTPERPATVATVAGVTMSLPYLFYTAVSAPRFLLPTYALLTFAAAVGVAWTVRALSIAWIRVVVAGALLVPFTTWHIAAADDLNKQLERGAGASYELAALLRQRGGDDCAFGSPYGAVVIHLASGCRGFIFKPVDGTESRLAIDPILAERRRGKRIFVVAPVGSPVGNPVDGWARTELRGLRYAKGWVLYEPHDQT